MNQSSRQQKEFHAKNNRKIRIIQSEKWASCAKFKTRSKILFRATPNRWWCIRVSVFAHIFKRSIYTIHTACTRSARELDDVLKHQFIVVVRNVNSQRSNKHIHTRQQKKERKIFVRNLVKSDRNSEKTHHILVCVRLIFY